MPLTEAQREQIRVAIAAGRQPSRGAASNRTILATGAGGAGRNRYLVLASSGRLTDSGRFYYSETGQPPPRAAYDRNQPVITRGARSYVRGANGRERLVRRLGVDGEAQLTALGRDYYRDRHTEYIVHVPVIIEGRRANGRTYTRQTRAQGPRGAGQDEQVHLPVSRLGLGQILESSALTREQAEARVRSRVLQELSLRTSQGKPVLMEVSGETYYYDREGQWLMSSMSTEVDAETGLEDTQVQMRVPMGTLRGLAAHLPHADQICDSAWEEHADKLCIPRQLAELLRTPLHEVCASFDAALDGQGWREVGVTGEELQQWCVLYGHPLFFCAAGCLLAYHEPPEKQGKAIACYLYDGHGFIYKNARALANYRPAAEKRAGRTMLRHEVRSQLEPWSEWKLWDGTPAPGLFYVDDLAFVRRKLLESGRSPKVGLRDLATIQSLTYHCVKSLDGCSGACRIRELPPDAHEIQAWLQALPVDVEYRGQRLPSITQEVFLALLKAERRTPGPDERKRLLEEYDNKCALCGGIFDGDLEWDHVAPLRGTARGARQLFHPICSSCHQEKTALEGRQDRTLESCFSEHAWHSYAESPRPPALVWSPHSAKEGLELLELDVRRCRRNALAHSAHDFAVFCPLDNIVPAEPGRLCDFSFVRLPKSRASALGRLPYLGAGWYHRVAVEFLLAHNICSWEHILWSYHATAHVLARCVEEPLRKMEESWGDEATHRKLSVNMMVGLWASERDAVYSVKTSSSAADAPGSFCTRAVHYDGGSTIDHVYQTKVLTNWSWRPVHDQIMQTEHTRVAQLLYVLKALKVPPRCVKAVKTDALILQEFAAKHKKHLQAIANTTFEDLPHLRAKYEKLPPGQQQLDARCAMAGRKGDADNVFRFAQGEGVRLLEGTYKEPSVCAPEPVPVPPWRYLSEEEALRAAEEEGLFVEGQPGTGKTTWVRQLVVRLRETGHTVDICAKTHSAVQNFGCGAATLDHYVRKHIRAGGLHVQYLVVDELTQVNSQLWSDLVVAKMYGVKLILCGDFGQFSAICDAWLGTPLAPDALAHSDLVRELVCSNRFRLTQNRRSDPGIFDFICSLRPGEPEARDLQDALAEARQLFPATDQPADWTLTMSHARRHAINRQRNLALKPKEGAVYCRWRPCGRQQNNDPQSLWVWPGLALIGAGGKVLRGILTQVVRCTPEEVELSGGQTLAPDQLVRCCRPAHALVYAGSQGLTLPGRVRLETDSAHMTLRHLYVGMSRATSSALLEVL